MIQRIATINEWGRAKMWHEVVSSCSQACVLEFCTFGGYVGQEFRKFLFVPHRDWLPISPASLFCHLSPIIFFIKRLVPPMPSLTYSWYFHVTSEMDVGSALKSRWFLSNMPMICLRKLRFLSKTMGVQERRNICKACCCIVGPRVRLWRVGG